MKVIWRGVSNDEKEVQGDRRMESRTEEGSGGEK